MKKTHKFLLFCGALVGAGLILTIVGFSLGGGVTGVGISRSGLNVFTLDSYMRDKEKTAPVVEDGLEEYTELVLNVDNAAVILEPSDTFTLEYSFYDEIEKPVYNVEDSRLTVTQKSRYYDDSDSLYFFQWGNNFSNMLRYKSYIRLGIPAEAVLETAELNISSGDFSVDRVTAGSLNIHNSYGNTALSRVSSGPLTVKSVSGDISLDEVTAKGLSVIDNYGSITLRDVNANDLEVDMKTGSLYLERLFSKKMTLGNSFGSVDGSRLEISESSISLSSGDCNLQDFSFRTCDIRNDYGSVDLSVNAPLTSYGLDLSTSYGEIELDGRQLGSSHFSMQDNPDEWLRVICQSGDIVADSNYVR